jgi:peroxiredoxin Q/BCP
VAYFGISVDSAEKNKEFGESLRLDYPLLSDPEKRVAKAYGVLMPVVGLAKRWTFYIGKDGTILHVDRDVDVKTAGADLAARLAALGVGRRKKAE